MVHIKQKGVYGVENPLPRSFMGGDTYTDTDTDTGIDKTQTWSAYVLHCLAPCIPFFSSRVVFTYIFTYTVSFFLHAHLSYPLVS